MATEAVAKLRSDQGSGYLFNADDCGRHPTLQVYTHLDLPGDAAKEFALGLLLRMDAPALQRVRDAADARLDELTTEAMEATLPLLVEAVPYSGPLPGGVTPRQWSGGTPMSAQLPADAETEQVPA